MALVFSIKGNKRLSRNLERLRRRYLDASNEALKSEAKRVIEQAIPITPMLSGDLRSDLVVGNLERSASLASVRVGVEAGSDSELYAERQHEVQHTNYTTAGTASKFLQRAFKMVESTFLSMMARKIKAQVKV